MPPNKNRKQRGFSDLASRLAGTVLGFGSRLVVHCCALALAAIISSKGPGGLLLCIYIGLVCLVPCAPVLRPGWLVPVFFGLLLVSVWQIWGFPWSFAIIWGGALTWVIRLLARRGRAGWEWSVLPAMLAAMFVFFDTLLPLVKTSPPYFTFPLFAAAGWAFLFVFTRLFGDPAQRIVLKNACARLERLGASDGLPEELRPAARQLGLQGRRMLGFASKLGEPTADLVGEFDRASNELADSGSGGSASTSGSLKERLEGLYGDLELCLASLAPPKPESPEQAEARALAARLDVLREQVRLLVEKGQALPARMRENVSGIADSAEQMTRCLKKNPGGAARGERFLARYLKSAHMVVDEYVRIAAGESRFPQVIATLENAGVLLSRMEDAFVAERAALLRNEVVNFSAELKVLDTLLKMDGK